MKKGLFIAFEGIDGCGKSTQLVLSAKRLRDLGQAVLTTREPGGTHIAEKIRDIIIDPENSEMHNECELLLYLAARAQHVREKIQPTIEKGSIVLCDRFQLATFAYQGFGRSIPMEQLKALNLYATGGISPDITFIFSISIEASFNRMATMNKNPDRLESSGKEFYENISHGYEALAKQDPNVVVIDGEQSQDIISETVFNNIIGRIQNA